ncbi:MAG: hypothetical protein MI924_17745 [Chloroflexales bacterium]|nr:hypothetical protein [Chloroflexales bacterium]
MIERPADRRRYMALAHLPRRCERYAAADHLPNALETLHAAPMPHAGDAL